jgi:Tol biopolymer transport system component
MSVDARIRRGLTMIEKELPTVDTVEGFDSLERDIRRDRNRRRTVIGVAAAAAVLVAASGAFLVHRDSGNEIHPAPPPHQHAKVYYFDNDGKVSYVGDDGARQTLPVNNVDRVAFSSGGQVAYITDDGKTRSLWIADTDGSNAQQQPASCDGCKPGYGVTWSNDGRRLAYAVFTPGHDPTQLRVLTVGSDDALTFDMPRGCDPRGPRFSPDDQSLAFNLSCHDGEHVATLDPNVATSTPTKVAGSWSQVQVPSWSRDGETLYFTATTSGDNTNDVTASIDVFAVGADGTNLRQITHAAPGERYFGATPVGNGFLVSRAEGSAPSEVGWLSADGSTFTPKKDSNGEPLLGSQPRLQP